MTCDVVIECSGRRWRCRRRARRSRCLRC
jgi:hypothetical protein